MTAALEEEPCPGDGRDICQRDERAAVRVSHRDHEPSASWPLSPGSANIKPHTSSAPDQRSLSLSSWILLSLPLAEQEDTHVAKMRRRGGHDDGLVHFLKNLDIFVYCKVKNYYPWINVKVTSGALINGRRVCVCKLNIITKTNVPTLSTIGGFLPLPPLHPAFGEYSSGWGIVSSSSPSPGEDVRWLYFSYVLKPELASLFARVSLSQFRGGYFN